MVRNELWKQAVDGDRDGQRSSMVRQQPRPATAPVSFWLVVLAGKGRVLQEKDKLFFMAVHVYENI